MKQHSDLDPYFTPTSTVEVTYRKFLESCINSKDKTLLVAAKNGELAGYAAGEIQQRSSIFKVTQNGYINDVFVLEKFRKHGIAKKFLNELKTWFNSKGVEYVELSVHANNEIGKKTWAKFGFEAYELKEIVTMEQFVIH